MEKRKHKQGLFVAVMFLLALLTWGEGSAQIAKGECSRQESAKLQEVTFAISGMV